jgi:pilus assembly protein Flp/PilA
MKNSAARFLKDDSGASALEYALVAAGMVVALVAGISAISDGFTGMATNLAGKLS